MIIGPQWCFGSPGIYASSELVTGGPPKFWLFPFPQCTVILVKGFGLFRERWRKIISINFGTVPGSFLKGNWPPLHWRGSESIKCLSLGINWGTVILCFYDSKKILNSLDLKVFYLHRSSKNLVVFLSMSLPGKWLMRQYRSTWVRLFWLLFCLCCNYNNYTHIVFGGCVPWIWPCYSGIHLYPLNLGFQNE